MAYVKLSDETKIGTGFITHKDWDTLSFNGQGDIFIVTGTAEDVSNWADRVKGTVMADADAVLEIKAARLVAINTEITNKTTELAALNVAKVSLGVKV